MGGSLVLGFPVHALDGREVLPAGVVLTDGIIEDVAARGRGLLRDDTSLLEYDRVREDVLAFVGEGAYRVIFSHPSDLADLLVLMEKTRLPRVVLDPLGYFRRVDPYTYRHILLVFALSSHLARRLMRRFEDILRGASAGPLHDFGKICVPPAVLAKEGILRRGERRLLEHHAAAGFVLLRYYLGGDGAHAAVAARDHHERGDGSGYPRGIRLADRLVEIVAACDVYDALISPRPYRRDSYDNRTALEEITRMGEEGKISWDAVTLLVALNRKERPDPDACAVSRERRGVPPEGNLYGIILDGDEEPRTS